MCDDVGKNPGCATGTYIKTFIKFDLFLSSILNSFSIPKNQHKMMVFKKLRRLHILDVFKYSRELLILFPNVITFID